MYATDPFLCFSYNYTLLCQCKWGEQESIGIGKRHHILHNEKYCTYEGASKLKSISKTSTHYTRSCTTSILCLCHNDAEDRNHSNMYGI